MGMPDACYYLGGSLLALLFLLPYWLQYKCAQNILPSRLWGVLCFLLGIFAGGINEDMGITLVALLDCFLYLYWRKCRGVYFWTLCGLFGAGLGAGLAILLPSVQLLLAIKNYSNGF